MDKIISYEGLTPFDENDIMAKVTTDSGCKIALFTVPSTEQFTISYWIKGSGKANVELDGQVILETQVSDEWKKVTKTFDATKNDEVVFSLASGEYYIYQAQIERGNIATDYEEAPEDVETTYKTLLSITADGIMTEVSQKIGAQDEKISQIGQTADLIYLVVKQGSTESKIELTPEVISAIADTIVLKGNHIQLDGDTTVGQGFVLSADHINTNNLIAKMLLVKDDDGNNLIRAGVKENSGDSPTDTIGGSSPSNTVSIAGWNIKKDMFETPDGTGRFVPYSDGAMLLENDSGQVEVRGMSATLNGARGVHIECSQGEIEVGDKAGQVKIGTANNTGMFPIGTVNDESSNANTQISYIRTNNTASPYAISVNGKWGSSSFASHTITSASSDIRLKDNVKDTKIDNALDVINQIKVRTFDWKETDEHQSIGFIADELEQIDDRFTVGGGYEEDGTPIYKSIDTLYMNGYLVKAMQEMTQIVKEQQAEINKLKETIKSMAE